MKPTVTRTPDGYSLKWQEGIEALAERVTEHRDELGCELTVNTTRPPKPGMLHWGRFNLSSEQTRTRLAAKLAKRDADVDWDGLMEQLCVLVADEHRRGDPAVDLREVPIAVSTRWLVEPFVELAGPTVLFADGGTGKSLTALAIAATCASGKPIVGKPHGDPAPVLYLDWETDAATTSERLHAVCWGAGVPQLPPVHYRRQIASLEAAAPEIRREIARIGAGLVVVDSLGAARGGEPESADLTIRTFNAARSLGVPMLFVDHVTKAAGNGSDKAFGSVYTHNLARITWSMDKAQDEGQKGSTVLLTNRKRNNGHLLPRVAYRVVVEADDDGVLSGITFQSVDAVDTPMADRLPVKAQIWAVLRHGGKALKELSEEIGVAPETVARTLRRYPEMFVKQPDGTFWNKERES